MTGALSRLSTKLEDWDPYLRSSSFFPKESITQVSFRRATVPTSDGKVMLLERKDKLEVTVELKHAGGLKRQGYRKVYNVPVIGPGDDVSAPARDNVAITIFAETGPTITPWTAAGPKTVSFPDPSLPKPPPPPAEPAATAEGPATPPATPAANAEEKAAAPLADIPIAQTPVPPSEKEQTLPLSESQEAEILKTLPPDEEDMEVDGKTQILGKRRDRPNSPEHESNQTVQKESKMT